MITFVSFFAGIAGFDKGFEDAGMQCKAQIEIDKNCRFVLEKRYPHVDRSVADIKEANKDNVPRADVYCGGFPCQDLSVAGKRAGLDGSRSGLWYEFHRVIDSVRPEWVVIEQVPGLLSSNGGQDFAILLGGLTGTIPEVPDAGWGNAGFAKGPIYKIAYRILDAQFFGVAQRRRRVFIVGHLGDGRAAEVLFESEGGQGDIEAGGETRPELARDIAASLRVGGSSAQGLDAERGLTLAPRLSYAIAAGSGGSKFGSGRHNQDTFVVSRDAVPKTAGGKVTDLRAGNPHPSAVVFQQNQRNEVRDMGDQAGALPAQPGQNYLAVAFTEHTRRDGRNLETQDEKAYALTNPDSGGRTHSRQIAGGFGVRRLTPTECERLQGFPDGWTEGLSDSARYRALGNAVCVPMARWVGQRIITYNNAGFQQQC